MPAAFSKPCQYPGCNQLTSKGHYCLEHYQARRTAHDHHRGSSAARGYGGRWQRYRATYLLHPDNALCRHCFAAGLLTPANHVDHIIAVEGPNDPLFWPSSNHQPLCHACHSKKTVEEDQGFGRRPTHPPFV